MTNQSSPVRVNVAPDGSRTYLVDLPPEELPAVRGHDLERAWYAARDAAIEAAWGAMRAFRFLRPDGTTTDLALADPDACCWARAVDRTVGLGNCYGLSLCLRLLALVDLLARAHWTGPYYRLQRDGAELDLALLRVAATAPLTPEIRFDEAVFRARLGPQALPPAVSHPRISGAMA